MWMGVRASLVEIRMRGLLRLVEILTAVEAGW
jgi:hypothetical protein